MLPACGTPDLPLADLGPSKCACDTAACRVTGTTEPSCTRTDAHGASQAFGPNRPVPRAQSPARKDSWVHAAVPAGGQADRRRAARCSRVPEAHCWGARWESLAFQRRLHHRRTRPTVSERPGLAPVRGTPESGLSCLSSRLPKVPAAIPLPLGKPTHFQTAPSPWAAASGCTGSRCFSGRRREFRGGGGGGGGGVVFAFDSLRRLTAERPVSSRPFPNQGSTRLPLSEQNAVTHREASADEIRVCTRRGAQHADGRLRVCLSAGPDGSDAALCHLPAGAEKGL